MSVRSFSSFFIALGAFFLLGSVAAAQIVVAQDGRGDFNGTDEKPLIQAISAARAKGGGEIVIHAGTYLIGQSLEIKNVTNLTLRGMPGAILKLAPLQYAEVKHDVPPGEKEIPVSVQRGFTTDTIIQVQAPGALDPFSGKAKPTFSMKLSRVDQDRLVLAEALAFPVPSKTLIVNERAPNLFEVREGAENIVIERLVIDGGRVAEDPLVRAHAQACGIFASGRYSYTDGPTGPLVRGLTVRDCVIRNCFGRGVALYATADATVTHCRFVDIVDEAIDLDHFTVNCRVLDNEIVRCRVGVELNDANECWVARNRIEACETGVVIWRWCKMEDLNVRNQVLDNLIVNVAGNALQFERGTRNNVARGNIIRGTKRNGISLNATLTVVTGNLIEQTAMHGIIVSGDDNEISGNRVSEAGFKTAQKFTGIRVLGGRNQVLDNVVRAEDGAMAVPDDGGKENTIR